MRAYQFIIEYRRDVTSKSMGDKLITTLLNSQSSGIPDELIPYHTLINMAFHPEKYYAGKTFTQGTIRMNPETAPETFMSHKQDIIDSILAVIESQDPTPNKEYTQWLARSWINSGGKSKIEDMNRNNLLGMFTLAKRKKKISPEYADVNKFKTYNDFEKTILSIYPNIEELSSTEKKEVGKGESNTVFDDANVRVIVPNNQDAACYYGQGTRWCTAATQGNNMFDYYNRQGKLYIILPKKPKYDGEKYQLHFNSGQFMDEGDEPVDLVELLESRFPELKEFFIANEPEIESLVVFTPDDLLNGIGEFIGEAIMDFAFEVINEWESSDDYYHEWKMEQAEERGYVDDDGEVDWDKVYDDDDLNDYTEFNSEARYYLRDAKEIAEMSASEIKEYAANLVKEDDEPIYIENLDKVYEYAVKDKMGSSDGGLGEFIRRKISVDTGNRSSSTVLGKVGEWVISLSK